MFYSGSEGLGCITIVGIPTNELLYSLVHMSEYSIQTNGT